MPESLEKRLNRAINAIVRNEQTVADIKKQIAPKLGNALFDQGITKVTDVKALATLQKAVDKSNIEPSQLPLAAKVIALLHDYGYTLKQVKSALKMYKYLTSLSDQNITVNLDYIEKQVAPFIQQQQQDAQQHNNKVDDLFNN